MAANKQNEVINDAITSTNTITNKRPFVERVIIKGLFGRKDIDWTLGDVNVLVGQNGSGKSTILRVIYDALRAEQSPTDDFTNLKSLSILLSNGYDVNYDLKSYQKVIFDSLIPFMDKINEVKRKTKNWTELSSMLGYEMGSEPNSFSGKMLTEQDGKQTNLLLQKVHVEYLSTFDMMLLSKKEYSDISDTVFTQLDLELERDINRLTEYQLALSNQTIDDASAADNTESVADIRASKFSRVNKFEQALNTMFNPNDKQFKISEKGRVEVYYDNEKIELTSLSSGEKQLILILLRVVNTSDKPTILLLDEPEISLHLSWQESLIKTIKDINEDCQLIIVTHSPALVMNGWMDSYIDLKDISVDSSSE